MHFGGGMKTHITLESTLGSETSRWDRAKKGIRNTFLAILAGAIAACVPTQTQPKIEVTPTGEATYLPTETGTLEATMGLILIYTLDPTASATPTVTATPLPNSPPQEEFKPDDFGLPVAFEGEYSLGHELRYSPCYHWDPITFDPAKVTTSNWYSFFHAGDMYLLNITKTPQEIVVLSPVSGKVAKVVDFGDNGLVVNIETDYLYEGSYIWVDIAHMNSLFLGDSKNPVINTGSIVNQGQPLGYANYVYNWGRPEQALDIAIRNGPEGASPLYSNFSPQSYLDPYLFLIDDLTKNDSNIIYDYFRDHCIKSTHFP